MERMPGPEGMTLSMLNDNMLKISRAAAGISTIGTSRQRGSIAGGFKRLVPAEEA